VQSITLLTIFVLALVPLLHAAPKPLAIIRAGILETEDGQVTPPGWTHIPGETVYVSFQVEGFTVSPKQTVQLTYRIEPMDSESVLLAEPVAAKVDAELSPQDKDWLPKVRHTVLIPPLAGPGMYRVQIAVRDELSGASASKQIAFQVRGHAVEPSITLVIRNFRFHRSEEDAEPLKVAAYRPGDALWARFDMTGYKLAEKNAYHVSYGLAVAAPSGKVIYTNPEAAVEKDSSFYPRRYQPAIMNLSLQPNMRPGEYSIVVTVRDHLGNQNFETKQVFRVD